VDVVRHEVLVPGNAHPLYTDMYDLSRAELIEAMASADRSDVRMALDQLLDYMRYIDHKSLAVLTPSPISEDLVDLLSRHGVFNIYETSSGGFDRMIIASTELHRDVVG
jgi:phosphomevalonate kinase